MLVEGMPESATIFRAARAPHRALAGTIVPPWTLPPGAQPGRPLPVGVSQMLWIDVESLLPLECRVSIPPAPKRGIPAIPD
jgi:hypothetical protein